ncbi:MAG: hypothetical protein ACPGJE_02440, partial [Wenzhouxiangellaceae bacterium]
RLLLSEGGRNILRRGPPRPPLLLLLLLVAPVDAPAQTRAESENIPGLMTEAAEAYAAQDHVRWAKALEQLHSLRPYNYDFMRQLVMAHALNGDTNKAFSMMLQMQQQGLAEDWDQIEQVESLRSYPLYSHLRDLMRDAQNPFGGANTEWRIPPRTAMPEALAHDSETGRTFVGTVRDGKILVRAPGSAELTEFASPDTVEGLQAVFALHADAERGHLWVATGSVSQFRDHRASDFGRTALIKLGLAEGKKLGEYRVLPDGVPHLLGAIDLASDGTVYAADTLTPVVYRLMPGDERPQILTGNPMFTGLRGLALSEDETRLYLSDYDLGVFFLELGDEIKGYRLGAPDTLNLGGIDGVYQWQDSLIVIQNGVSPQRVLRLDLDESGRTVESIAAIAVAQPEFDTPTFGTLAGDDLLFLAGSHWQHVSAVGRPYDPPLPPVAVMRAPLDQAESMVLGKEMIERIKRGEDSSGGTP